MADKPPGSSSGTSGASGENLLPPTTETPAPKQSSTPHTTWRLFGSHMNSFVAYADAHTAWLMTDDFYGKISSTLYQRISSGQHMGGVKLVRGYSEGPKGAEKKPDIASSISRPVTPTPESKALKVEVNASYKRKSMPPSTSEGPLKKDKSKLDTPEVRLDPGRVLQRHLSGLDGESMGENQMLEDEMKEDYKNPDDGDSEDQGREIEYLLLTTHG